MPSENELAEYFGVSRLKIRESLRILIGRSILNSSQGRKAVIAAKHSSLLSYVVTSTVMSAPGWHTDLCQVRKALESEAALLACSDHEHINFEMPHKYLEQMKKISDQIENSRKNNGDFKHLINEYHEADLNFHVSLVKASNNKTLFLLFNSLSVLIKQSFTLTQNVKLNPSKNFNDNYKIHNDIFESVLEGYFQRADNIISCHMQKVQHELQNAITTATSKSR